MKAIAVEKATPIYSRDYFGFVYLWYNKVAKKFYIGSHFGSIDDGYVCSSSWMKRAYNKAPQNFKPRRILHWQKTPDKKSLLEAEQQWLNQIKDEELGKRYYNLKKLAGYYWWLDDGMNVKQKIKTETKIAMWRPDIRQKYLDGLKKRKYVYTEKRGEGIRKAIAEDPKKFAKRKATLAQKDVREKAWMALAPILQTPEYKAKMSESIKRRWQDPEYRKRQKMGRGK